MRARLRIAHLADHPEAIPVMRRWFDVKWAAYDGPGGPGDAKQEVWAYASLCQPRKVAGWSHRLVRQ
jgi:hypothetical protein